MYIQAKHPFSRPDSGQTSGPPSQPPPVRQGGSHGRVRHGNGASGMSQEEQEASTHTYEEAEAVKRCTTYTSADRMYPGGACGRGALCSFIRPHLSYLAAGIAVLLSLVAVGFAPLTFINKERDQDDMRKLLTTLDNRQRSLVASLEQRLHKISKTLLYCPTGYTIFREICYKAFNTRQTFSGAAAACGEGGGTLAMPRDSGTNGFLISLYKSVSENDDFWIGLHDQREEGSFEWVDGSALGTYSSWRYGQPDDSGGREDCVSYSTHWKDNWNDLPCDRRIRFICQAFPGRPVP
ncbi:C-type lectin domain family 3 member A homolog [Branchiostoma floridae]|uniref:C-type lectin domain family 3 member A homolog n=1 Tax=Branchiostoma floridae TaxID=7739 RepID=A0A9J7LBU5_BRAFL|nr:C-type lectin domain family 3 member A homolog [Branchiostoma floridae]